ncbi:hypothetical protein GOP47_0026955 [Adiantum capillus-veneris]|nr:hypothetical protein GOP47_0026955 [Adiantum capillus-veneris]
MRRAAMTRVATAPYARCQGGEQLPGMPIAGDGNQKDLPDEISMVSLLRSCAIRKDLDTGSKLHAEIRRRGLQKTNVFIGNTLVSMYAKCGAISKAEQAFDELPFRDIVSWTALIAGYCQQGHGEEALACLEEMQDANLAPNALTFTCILKACSSLRGLGKGQDIHFEIARNGMLQTDVVLGSALVDMYAKCGALGIAQQVFEELPARNIVSWTALIAGYCQHGHVDKALACFQWMEEEGPSPNATTFTCILNACANIGAVDKGRQVHGKMIGLGLVSSSIELGNALVDMYTKCGAIVKAQQLFDGLPVRDVVSWTTLITGYCRHGFIEEAFSCFDQMKFEGLSANPVTFTCMLNACGSIQAAAKGIEIHAEAVKRGFLDYNIMLGNALVDMYGKCGSPLKAQQVFNELSSPNLVSWTTLITGYCQYGHGEQALYCFEKMKDEGFYPDVVTLACILKACGRARAAEKGKEIHTEIVRTGLLSDSIVLRSALLDMYIRCGALSKAQEVFDELQCRDVVSINALIAGYCRQGLGEKAVKVFEQFKHEGLFDAVTLLCVLKAIGSIGAAGMGQTCYETLGASYGIILTVEHHVRMVDLLTRAGHFHEALPLMQALPTVDYNQSWFVLLGACQRLGNAKLGRLAFEQCGRTQ